MLLIIREKKKKLEMSLSFQAQTHMNFFLKAREDGEVGPLALKFFFLLYYFSKKLHIITFILLWLFFSLCIHFLFKFQLILPF
jgi:hypothetical protein